VNYFSQNITSIRKEKKLSQMQMATFLRVPLKTYQSWEEGRAKPRKEDTWMSIADRLQLTIDQLFRPKNSC
jgi:DNA-binding transcriptional regulator YiaG